MMVALLWTVFETTLGGSRDYTNPLWDVTVRVRFTAPSGRQHTIDAFWDDERTWRVRFCPDEVGEWSWQSECSDTANAGLHGQQGRFRCAAYDGDNPLYRHGTVRLSENRRHFVHADGAPFFWLSDTAWNGVMKAKPDDWERYLTARREQGFTAVQFVSTQFRALPHDEQGETAYTGGQHIHVNPRFFQRLDGKVAAINQHGLVAVPVLLWALGKDAPGTTLPEEDATRLARYIVARWGAYQVIWILGGDGNYRGENAERWKRIGRAVFGDRHDRLVTMHPQGLNWVADEFRDETWFDFVGYQSGHGDSADHMRWLVMGSPAQDWSKEPPRPIVNLEPNYEAHLSYHSKQRFDAHKIRRALYWSLLVSPTAGVTYGHHGIWFWAEKPEVPTDHPHTGEAPLWQEALYSEGTKSVRHLKTFFASLPWWRLRPALDLLSEPNDANAPHRFVAATRTDDGDVAVVYLPEGGAVTLRTEALKRPAIAQWFNPRTGEWTAAGKVTEATQQFTASDHNDWVLCLRSQ